MLGTEQIPVYTWSIDDDDPKVGVYKMSIVDDPAVGISFIKYSKQQQKLYYSINRDKQVITGVAIRADHPILREKEDGTPFYTIFEPPVIEQIVHKFMRELHNRDVNINHLHDTEGAYLFESFILTDKNRGCYDEFREIKNGSWIVSYKVDDPKLWERIKKGDLNGFSVEIYGRLTPVEPEQEFTTEQLIKLHNTVNAILS